MADDNFSIYAHPDFTRRAAFDWAEGDLDRTSYLRERITALDSLEEVVRRERKRKNEAAYATIAKGNNEINKL